MSYIEEVAQGKWYRPDLVKGYSEDEIKQIEALYSICIQGEFKQFMRCMGRSSGGLLAERTMMLYNLQPRSHMIRYKAYNDDLLHYSGYDFSYKNSFFFACIWETNLYFLKTTSNNPDYTGELLPQSTHIGAEYVDDYLNKQQAYINELIKIHPNRHYDITQIKGYSLSEISAFEHVYKIQITGQLKDFMHYMGRSSGGLLSDDFIFYNKMSLIEKVNYIDRTIENTWSKEPETCHYKDDYRVYHYSEGSEDISDTGQNFTEFLKGVVIHYAHNGSWILQLINEIIISF
ncbi:hypothetical protein [Psychrobacter sp. I-STPA6b]|uniref:hypothetical protein n=1 Tax=Psychrobacter sp. I-STPA6b TaxID=2585718 RepID=UPI001D0C2C38|nr:hypothetical protein [Psychrobacter sp. I-STPA6b]